MKTYLALDLGTYMGWARGAGRKIASGAWDFKTKKHEAPSLRFIRFKQRLMDEFVMGIDMVFYERIHRHRGTDAAHIYGKFLFDLHEVCDTENVPYLGLSVQEIKKFATGKGNASKEMMIAAAKKAGFDTHGDDDEADAIWILKCGMETKV